MSKKKKIKYGYLVAENNPFGYKKCKIVCEMNDCWVCVLPDYFDESWASKDLFEFGKVGETFFYDERDAKMEALRIANLITGRENHKLKNELYELKGRVIELENRPWWRIWK